jgi:hypothetical protein
MRFLQALRALLQTWQGVVLTILAILGAIYYGPRKMLETYDWYLDRFRDNDVFFLIQRRKMVSMGAVANFAPPSLKELPYTVKEIADHLARKESSIERSVNRLTKRGKLEPFQDGWRLKG